jgi:hypothetical protein
MKLLIEIDLDNSAFQDNPNEIRDVLKKVAAGVTDSSWESFPANFFEVSFIQDSNGNTVGSWTLKG